MDLGVHPFFIVKIPLHFDERTKIIDERFALSRNRSYLYFINIDKTQTIMKTAFDYSLQPGSLSLKYYRFYTPGLCTYKTKSKIIEALNLGIEVYRLDKIIKTIHKWNGDSWEIVEHLEGSGGCFNDSYF